MYSTRRPLGMQVHAVPDSERFVDSTGRKLPWGYDYNSAAAGDSERKEQPEKGPFGRNSSRRSKSGHSRSRSKTAEPRREEDRQRAENMAAEDAVFGSMRRHVAKEDNRREKGSVDAGFAAVAPFSETADEPAEVLLYGFGRDLQWAAIDFYERVSNGVILEDYDRQPPGQRYDPSMSASRAAAQNTMSRAAMRMRNRYAGGQHWIKVTYNSRQASEMAIASSPHVIRGCLVYAEPYQNRGPQRDEAVLATQAGAQITSDVLPPTFSTNPLDASPNGSSTVSSATATATTGAQEYRKDTIEDAAAASSLPPSNQPNLDRLTPFGSFGASSGFASSTALRSNSQAAAQHAVMRPSRVEGSVRAKVFSADLALAPKQPTASWSSWIGASEIIGSAVPRTTEGKFDWNAASFYWKIFFWIDSVFGTDFCGLKADD